MESNTKVVSGGLSTTGLLGVAFIVLKLLGIIDWSWWWVLAPFWMPVAISIVIIIIVVSFLIIMDA